jgi:4-amino-4-deoxy-L-arabinose transferase-like glycosyltransferase
MINNKLSSNYKYLLLFVLSLIYLFLFIRILWRIGDEGILVNGAQLVAQGKLPYRDFIEVMGPASFYWLGLFFKLFGINIYVARGVLILTASFTIIVLYWMTRRIYRGPFDILPSLFFLVIGIPLWPGASHHWDSNLFALLAVGAFFLWQDRGRRWFLALSGVLAGLTSCFIQPKGLYIILAFALVVWCNGYRAGQVKLKIVSSLVTLLTCYVGVGCLVLLFFYFSGGFYELIYANLIWPLANYSNVNIVPYGFGLIEFFISNYVQSLQNIVPSLLIHVLGALIIIPLLIIYSLPIIIILLTFAAYIHRSNRVLIFSATMLPYLASGFALWFSELHRKDIIHLIYGSPIMLIILIVFWNYCFDNRKVLKLLGLILLTMSLVLLASFNALIALSANEKIVSRQGTLYGFKQDLALKFLIEHTKRGDYTFIYPYYPMYYFLADNKNPTRYFTLISHFHTDAQFKEVIEDLKMKHVKYVLWDTLVSGSNLKTWFPQYKRPSRGCVDLERYLEDHYEFIGKENGFRILRRKDEKLLPFGFSSP